MLGPMLIMIPHVMKLEVAHENNSNLKTLKHTWTSIPKSPFQNGSACDQEAISHTLKRRMHCFLCLQARQSRPNRRLPILLSNIKSKVICFTRAKTPCASAATRGHRFHALTRTQPHFRASASARSRFAVSFCAQRSSSATRTAAGGSAGFLSAASWAARLREASRGGGVGGVVGWVGNGDTEVAKEVGGAKQKWSLQPFHHGFGSRTNLKRVHSKKGQTQTVSCLGRKEDKGKKVPTIVAGANPSPRCPR